MKLFKMLGQVFEENPSTIVMKEKKLSDLVSEYNTQFIRSQEEARKILKEEKAPIQTQVNNKSGAPSTYPSKNKYPTNSQGNSNTLYVLFAPSGDTLSVLRNNNKEDIKLYGISHLDKNNFKAKQACKYINDLVLKKKVFFEQITVNNNIEYKIFLDKEKTASQVFSTAEDNQEAVTVHVVQGERKLAKDNKSLGQFNLMGIPPATRGTPKIEVSFDIDANGVIKVTAKDQGTGKENNIKITGSSGLTKEEIEKMIREAEQQKDKDEENLVFINKKNELSNNLYQMKKSGTINESEVTALESELNNASDIEALNKISKLIDEKLNNSSNKDSNNNNDDDIIDAEVVEKSN